VTILCYHAIDPSWTSALSVHPARFAQQCDWLATHREVLPLNVAVTRLDRSWRLPRGLAALTFDDGFRSLHEHAMPAIKRHQLPATVFLVAQTLVGQGRAVDWVDDPPEQALTTLNTDQVIEMQDAGVDFQSHSLVHADLTQMTFDECVRDLTDSRVTLEDLLHRPVTMLAYPRGRHNDVVRAAAERAGYTHAFSLPEAAEPFHEFAIPRVGIYHKNTAPSLQVKASRSYLRVRLSRLYGLRSRRRGDPAEAVS
jgi:peptidoglycan/xylan/chitin deacetylase (PgdA/CDA1 family)